MLENLLPVFGAARNDAHSFYFIGYLNIVLHSRPVAGVVNNLSFRRIMHTEFLDCNPLYFRCIHGVYDTVIGCVVIGL